VGLSGGYPNTSVLSPNGLVAEADLDTVPVLHLHGAVGWYRTRRGIEIHPADQPYNPALGQPALLMPDPGKDLPAVKR
jgi:hypothetical protein